MIKNIFNAVVFIIAITGCSKKTVDTPVAMVPERLEIGPASTSILNGGMATFTLKFFNNIGQQASVPASVVWSSANTTIATVNQQGEVTGKAPGQVEIKATYNTATFATALLTVAANNTTLAMVTIAPADSVELKLNATTTLVATGKNNAGGTITGLTFTWASAATSIADVSTAGLVTAKGYGTANITAASGGIQSAPVMVQVIREGNFITMGSAGMAKLKIENGILKLKTSGTFSVQTGPPDLRIYLGNDFNTIAGAVEVASLNQRTGAQSWNIASPTTIGQYKYAFVWCKQFGGQYGYADLGN